jgi:hypothetical protein
VVAQGAPVHPRLKRLLGGEVPRLRLGEPIEAVVVYPVMHMVDYIPHTPD